MSLVAGLGVWAILLAGCPKPSTQPKPGPKDTPAPTTRPATSRPTTAPAVAPLPKIALLTLDELTPKIAKPVNPANAKDIPPRAAAAVGEAEVALGRREYVAAITRLERAIGFAPGNARMHRALGMAYAGLLNRGKALSNLRKAVVGAPDDIEVQVLLGQLAAAQKQNASAIISFRTALKCSEADQANPLVGEVLFRLGDLLAVEGYHTAALGCFEQLSANIEKHGREYASRPAMREIVLKSELLLTRRGELLLKLRKPARAADLLTKSRKRDRTSVQTARLLLAALIAAKDVSGAVGVFHELAAETNMKNVVGGLAGELCEASGDKALPLKLWRGRKARGQYDGQLAVALAGAALKLGADDDAMTILQELLAVVPDDVVAGRALVTLQARRGKGDVALRVIAGLMASGQTGLAGARAGLAELAGAQLPENFERTFAASIKADKPTLRAALYYATGELARLRGKTELATDLLGKALKAKADFLPALEALADVYVAQGRFDKVDQLLAGLAGAATDPFRVLVIRGKVQLARGMVRQAIADLDKAYKLNAGDVDLLLLLARAYWQVSDSGQGGLGRLPESDLGNAVKILSAAMRAAPDDMRAFWMMFRMGVEPAEERELLLPYAKAVIARLTRTKAGSLDLKLMRAELALAEGKHIDAKRLVAALRSEAPTDKRVRMLAIRLDVESRWEALNADQQTALIRKARALVVAEPASIAATRLLTRALGRAGKTGEVVSIWQLLHRKRPGDLRVAAAYSEQLVKAEKHSQAADVLAKVVAADPKNIFRVYTLVRLLMSAERYTEAAGRLEKVLKRTIPARFSEVFGDTLAYLYYAKMKAYDKAQKRLDDMILTTGGEERLARLRGRKILVYGLAGKIDEARKYALGWIKREPDAMEPRSMLVGAMSEAKRWDQATTLVDGWLKARADAGADDTILAWCRQTKVRLLMQANKYAAALTQAEAFLKVAPKDHELLSLKSNCLAELGRHKEALASMEQAYASAPEEERIAVGNNLAYVYSENGINLDKAERMVRQSLAGMPGTVAYMDTLAWVFYKQGKIDAAIRQFDQVLKRDDLDMQGHPVIFDHAGDAFYRAGKTDRAVKLWTRAIAQAKKQPVATTEVRHVLAAGAKKIQAVREGKPAPVAPLGKGIKAEADKAPAKPAKPAKAAKPAKPAKAPAPAGTDEPKNVVVPRERE